MLGQNTTSFQAAGFEHNHRDGKLMGVIVVRGVYDLFPDGRLVLSEKQELLFVDEHEGDPFTTSLLRVTDIVPFKPNTDVTILGRTYPPRGERSGFWHFGIDVNQASVRFRCYGLRDWISDGKKNGKPHWRMSEVKPVDHVPLDYRYCPGNQIAGALKQVEALGNPLGAPFLDAAQTPQDQKIPVAMIMCDSDPVTDPYRPAAFAGTAPISPNWLSRKRYAGSYNQTWEQGNPPPLPKDFDYWFYQTACPNLIWKGFLRGDEAITLHQVTCGHDVVRFQLPQIQPFAEMHWLDGRQITLKLNLDGVHCDLRGREPPWRIDLTWRGWAEICPQFFKIDLLMTDLTDKSVEAMLQCDVNGLTGGVSDG